MPLITSPVLLHRDSTRHNKSPTKNTRPIRPTSPFIIYKNEHWSIVVNKMTQLSGEFTESYFQVLEILKEDWEKLSVEKKKQYKTKAKNDTERYDKELKVWRKKYGIVSTQDEYEYSK